MALTQERMIAVINAGNDYKQAVGQLTRHIEELVDEARLADRSPHEVLIEILSTCRHFDSFLRDPDRTKSTLDRETDYYRRNYIRNEYNARMTRARRERRIQDGDIPTPAHRRNTFTPSYARGVAKIFFENEEPRQLEQANLQRIERKINKQLRNEERTRLTTKLLDEPGPIVPMHEDESVEVFMARALPKSAETALPPGAIHHDPVNPEDDFLAPTQEEIREAIETEAILKAADEERRRERAKWEAKQVEKAAKRGANEPDATFEDIGL